MIPESRFGRLGLVGTVVYLSAITIIVTYFWDSFKVLEPNAWGDFLAGTFGPLALGWLVLGFFQQGDELRNSVKTLELQAEELRNSVEQQRELVAVSRQAMELDHIKTTREREERRLAIIPKLELTNERVSGVVGFDENLTLTNTGGAAKSISVYISNSGSYTRPFLGNGESWIIRTQSTMTLSQFENGGADVSCVDKDGNPHHFTLGIPF